MRFLVDECTGPSVARYLREIGHTVFSVYEQARGLKDAEILSLSLKIKFASPNLKCNSCLPTIAPKGKVLTLGGCFPVSALQ